MSSGQQTDGGLYESGIGWSIMLAVVAVLVWLFWYYQAEEVRNIVRWIRYGEMWALSWFIELGNMIGLNGKEGYKVPFQGQLVSWKQYFHSTPQWDKNALAYDHLALFNALTMQPMRIVFFVLACLGALWCIFKGPRTHYRTRLDLEGLIARQAKNFPIIAPFVDFNPSHQPPRAPGTPVPAELPPFAEALGPEEWLAYYEIPIPDGKLDEAAVAKAFKLQLYARWKGPMALKPYQQILLAAFCLKASRKRDLSDDMLGRLALCWSIKAGLKLNKDKHLLKDARKVLKDEKLAGLTLSRCNQHAFVTTALLRGLATAREEGGVLAPATFVWLRAYDRTLWYPLNNLGRQSFHTEAIGAMAHFKNEKMTQRPIPVPKVDMAVETMRDYVGSKRVRPIPQLDYSQSKKRGVKKAV